MAETGTAGFTAGFTPGPWRYERTPDGRYSDCHYIMSKAYSTPTILDGRDCIATCHGVSEETAANARLIAAAPELLASLKGVVKIADRSTVEFDRARAAIALAEGRP